MRQRAILFFLLSCTIHNNHAIAQRQLFATYSMNEGLVHNAIRNIFQDSRGFIWVATWEGLSMYDGNKFTNYTTVNGLSHGMVNDFFESGKGTLYITMNNGDLDLIKDNKTPQPVSKNNTIINHLTVMPNHKTIATTDRNGLCEFNEGKLFKPRQAYPLANYYHVTPFNDSLFLAQSDSSIELLNYRYEIFAQLNVSQPLFAEAPLLTDSKKRVWLGTRRGLRLLSPHQEKGQPLQFEDLPASFNLPLLKEQIILSLLEDDAGNIWIGTYYGLVRIGADGTQLIITKKDGLQTSDVTCLFQDREKNIWIGGSVGLARLVTKTKIHFYNADKGPLSDPISLLFPFANGDMIVGSQKGLQLFDKTTSAFTSIPGNRNYYSDEDQNSSLSLIMEKKSGIPYIVLSRKANEPVSFTPSVSGGNCVYKDRQNKYFYASFDGVFFSSDSWNPKKTLFYGDTRALLIDSKENLWVGSLDKGLYRIRYDYINDTPRIVRQDQYLPGIGIRSLYEDSKGFMWVGTRYHGIFRLQPSDPASGALHFDQSTGLTSNRITSLGEGKDGCIWISFYHGLDKLIPRNNSYRVFNFSRFNNFFTNIQSMILDKEHSVWLATSQGVVHIIDGEVENTGPLAVYITKAILGDSVYTATQKKISLSYRNKQVHFEFAAPAYMNEKQVMFSYRLAGSHNSEWSPPSAEHSVSYANLEPGDYRFEVRNKGWNDEWGEPANVSFNIAPPFWQTWWFRITCLSVLVCLLYWIVRRRINNIRHEAAMKQKISETEMIALRAQMNPHFIFNCLNAIDNLIQTNQKDKATVYLSRFAKLVRNVLDSSKNYVVPFHKDYESLQLYLQMEQFRCNNKFEYELMADDDLLHGDLKVPPLIIQPFVENAIHHGLLNKECNDKKLTITAQVVKDHIQYTISDNGIGRTRAEQLKQINKPEHRSYGIQITEERIHLYNQENKSTNDVTITDLYNDNEPSGTSVVIRLKITDNK